MSTAPMNLLRAPIGRRVASGLLMALTLAAPVARADANLAANMGCLNCHGSVPRGEAPSFERMKQRAARGNKEPKAIADHWLEEMRATASGPRAIVGHREVTDRTAQDIVGWLLAPTSQPVK
ncbi:hypothetical protein FVQ98_06785 [Ottowia sp. GY511]|uniref:C-type cytochrome n=1 Tax=Ottowia flava TaxID=2675430 RepID=A0ABW4KR79_9BURK|nr:hypothetical protein [Ottowia sp. GY511]TXK30997.1 hypothetical protein FVQ98_06785 [Ottowia sp. GY511]